MSNCSLLKKVFVFYKIKACGLDESLLEVDELGVEALCYTKMDCIHFEDYGTLSEIRNGLVTSLFSFNPYPSEYRILAHLLLNQSMKASSLIRMDPPVLFRSFSKATLLLLSVVLLLLYLKGEFPFITRLTLRY